jgi:hypothetical protein
VTASAAIKDSAIAACDQAVLPARTEYVIAIQRNATSAIGHAVCAPNYQERPFAISACRFVTIKGNLLSMIRHR